MNFNKFEETDVARFASQFAHTGILWVFHHIPKTAGSSLTRELNASLPPYRNVFADHLFPEGGNRHDALMESVEAFLKADGKVHYRSASGHLRIPHLKRIQEHFDNAHLFTFLREPADRLISDYRYAKTPKHPVYKEFAERFPTIEDYVENSGSQNKMWKYVAPSSFDASEKSLERIFNRYAFIGTLETINEDWAFFTSLFGCPKMMTSRVNVTEKQKNNEVDSEASLRARIRELNQKDYLLYDRVSAILAGKRDEMQAHVLARRAMWLGDVPVADDAMSDAA